MIFNIQLQVTRSQIIVWLSKSRQGLSARSKRTSIAPQLANAREVRGSFPQDGSILSCTQQTVLPRSCDRRLKSIWGLHQRRGSSTAVLEESSSKTVYAHSGVAVVKWRMRLRSRSHPEIASKHFSTFRCQPLKSTALLALPPSAHARHGAPRQQFACSKLSARCSSTYIANYRAARGTAARHGLSHHRSHCFRPLVLRAPRCASPAGVHTLRRT